MNENLICIHPLERSDFVFWTTWWYHGILASFLGVRFESLFNLITAVFKSVEVILCEIDVNLCCLCRNMYDMLLFRNYIYLNLRRLYKLWIERTIYANLCQKTDNPTNIQPSCFGLCIWWHNASISFRRTCNGTFLQDDLPFSGLHNSRI